MGDLEMTDADSKGHPLLMEEEGRILELYERLEELQLEIALLKDQGVLSPSKNISVYRRNASNNFQMSLKKSPKMILPKLNKSS